MKKVSLIIPIYNTNSYLHKCLSSAISQTYHNMEIICIDDGSTDGSDKILDEFAKKDQRIIAIHQKNTGESGARNAGLRIASGDYIGFMDCDDWIEANMYESLVNAIEQYNVDIAASSWIKEGEAYSLLIKNKYKVPRGIINQEQLMNYVYQRDAYQGFAYMWDKLYKKEILYNADGTLALFDEKLKLGGDVLFLAKVLMNTNRAIYIDRAFYHYYQRPTSGVHTKKVANLMDWLKSYQLVIEMFQKAAIDENIMIWVKRFLAYHSSNVAEIAYMQKKRLELEKCQRIMKQYENEYMLTNELYPERIVRYKKIMQYKL